MTPRPSPRPAARIAAAVARARRELLRAGVSSADLAWIFPTRSPVAAGIDQATSRSRRPGRPS